MVYSPLRRVCCDPLGACTEMHVATITGECRLPKRNCVEPRQPCSPRSPAVSAPSRISDPAHRSKIRIELRFDPDRSGAMHHENKSLRLSVFASELLISFESSASVSSFKTALLISQIALPSHPPGKRRTSNTSSHNTPARIDYRCAPVFSYMHPYCHERLS